MTSPFVTILDFIGTFAFAISGGLVATRHRLDLFGVLVLAFAAATAGGIVRDLVLNVIPVSLVDWRYVAVSTAAGLLTFYARGYVERISSPVQLFDAAGLGLFAVIGAEKALGAGLGPVGAVMLGVLTGVGGGVVRDVLVAQVPSVLRRTELYAVAAMAGAVVLVAGHALALPMAPVALAGAVLCFVLRWLAIRRGWKLPVAAADSSTE